MSISTKRNRIASGALVFATATCACADDYFWNNPKGGGYFSESNWNDGASGVPDSDDVAIFDVDATFNLFFIPPPDTPFPTAQRWVLHQGAITVLALFDDRYELLNPLPTTPSFMLAPDEGDAVELHITDSLGVDAQFAVIAGGPASTGLLRLSHDLAQLAVAQELIIGQQGNGTLIIEDDSEAEAARLRLASNFGSSGLLTLTGTAFDITNRATIGGGGLANVIIENQSDFTTGEAIIAQQFESTGTVTIDGAGSFWDIDGSLDVGMVGAGLLAITDGALVSCDGVVTLGTFPKSNGDPGGGGEALIRDAGSLFLVQDDLWVGFGADGVLTLSRGGRAQVTGNLLGPAANVGSNLIFELGSGGDYAAPAITVGGEAEDFDAEIIFVDGFMPAIGNAFVLLQAGAGYGNLDLTLPDLPADRRWRIIENATRITLEVIPSGPPGDVDGDGDVDFDDFTAVLAAWGDPGCGGMLPCFADIDGDGDVDFDDFVTVLANWS